MSYLKNIRTTMIENARAITRQGTWPTGVMKGSAHQDKLRRYFNAAGGSVFDINTDDTLDLNIGWAGKKKKAQMLELNRTNIGTKRAKVSRRIHRMGMWRAMGVIRLISQNMVPVGVDSPMSLDNYTSILVIRNHKLGSLTFSGKDQPSVAVAIEENKLLNREQVLAAWACFTRTNSKGEVVSFNQPSPWKKSV